MACLGTQCDSPGTQINVLKLVKQASVVAGLESRPGLRPLVEVSARQLKLPSFVFDRLVFWDSKDFERYRAFWLEVCGLCGDVGLNVKDPACQLGPNGILRWVLCGHLLVDVELAVT